MIPKQVSSYLSDFISEPEAKKLVGGTRQAWFNRKPKIQAAAGEEILPDTWIYQKTALNDYLAETSKYRTGAQR